MKNSFVLYDSWSPMVRVMSDQAAGQLLKACYAFANGEEYEITDETAAVVFETVRETMASDRVKYEEVCKKRREAALASKSKQKDANAGKRSHMHYESDSESDADADKREKSIVDASRRPAHSNPTVEEVREYCKSRGNRVDPQQFWSYYESQKWKKKNGLPLTDWKAGVRYWETTEKKAAKKGFDYENQRQYSPEDYKALERQLLRRT